MLIKHLQLEYNRRLPKGTAAVANNMQAKDQRSRIGCMMKNPFVTIAEPSRQLSTFQQNIKDSDTIEGPQSNGPGDVWLVYFQKKLKQK